MNRYTPR